MDKLININKKCIVILTKRGADWLNEYHQKQFDEYRYILEQCRVTDTNIKKVFPTELKCGDIIECPLWELIKKFGGYFDKGEIDAPFFSNEIKVIE